MGVQSCNDDDDDDFNNGSGECVGSAGGSMRTVGSQCPCRCFFLAAVFFYWSSSIRFRGFSSLTLAHSLTHSQRGENSRRACLLKDGTWFLSVPVGGRARCVGSPRSDARRNKNRLSEAARPVRLSFQPELTHVRSSDRQDRRASLGGTFFRSVVANEWGGR
jgi:hypothetical protein